MIDAIRIVLWRVATSGAALGVALGLTLAASSRTASAETIDEIYAAAKAEKTLMFWGAGPAAGHERSIRAFAQKYPGVEVKLLEGFSNVINTKLEEQFKSGKLEIDMLNLQTVQDFAAWNARGLLLHFKPDGFDQVGDSYKDKDGAWYALNPNPIAYGYNSDLVRAEDVPKSALDFLKPQFKGKLITAYPADDDATLYVFDLIVRKYGQDYMDKYMAQQPKFKQGHLGVSRSVASGESLASFDITVASTFDKQLGGKLALAIPTNDPVAVFFGAGAILKGAQHPNAAKLFASFLLSKEWQSQRGGYSARADVAVPDGWPPLSAYNLASGYRDFVINEKQMVDLRKRFEAYSGPVTNAGGVR